MQPTLEKLAWYLQFYNNGTWFDFIHFHESKTLGASKHFLGFVVFEFEENSCTYKRGKRYNDQAQKYTEIFHTWVLMQDVDEFVSSSDLEKCSIASLAHKWIPCSEWVPSE